MGYVNKTFLETQFQNFANKIAQVFAKKSTINGVNLEGTLTSTSLGIVWIGTHTSYESDKNSIPNNTMIIFTDDNTASSGGGSSSGGDVDLSNYVQLDENGKIPTDKIPQLLATLIEQDALHRFVTDTEKTNWNNKADISDIPTVPTKVSDLTNDSNFTSNEGTITEVKMNGASKGTSGVVDLGTVVTDVSGKADKTEIPTKLSDLTDDSTHRLVTDTDIAKWNSNQGGESGSSVSVTQIQTSGTHIADVSIDGTTTELYAPNGSDSATINYGTTTEFEAQKGSASVGEMFLITDDEEEVTEIDLTEYAKKTDIPTVPTDLKDFNEDTTHRLVTDTEKSTWNNKANTSSIPTQLSQLTEDSTHRLVTDAEKTQWNNNSGGSTVSVIQKQTSGTEIATITVDGTATKLYAPTSSASGGSSSGGDGSSINVWHGTLEEYEEQKDTIAEGTLLAIDDDDMAIGDLNDFFDVLNGGAEEMSSNIVYSNEEKVIGIFLGKTLYGKMFETTMTSLSNGSFTNTNISLTENSIEGICRVMAYRISPNTKIVTQCCDCSTYPNYDNDRIYTRPSYSLGAYSDNVIYFYFEYTKVGEEDVNS